MHRNRCVTFSIVNSKKTLAREVLDFIGYLEYRHGLRDNSDVEELKTAQESVMSQVWDNPDDEVWNDIPTR
ncbi:MAG: hypothetical protein HQL68_11140 [Magnetococcales bacterium]|nr:hypothetical protein [Magnetococcales bacterium]